MFNKAKCVNIGFVPKEWWAMTGIHRTVSVSLFFPSTMVTQSTEHPKWLSRLKLKKCFNASWQLLIGLAVIVTVTVTITVTVTVTVAVTITVTVAVAFAVIVTVTVIGSSYRVLRIPSRRSQWTQLKILTNIYICMQSHTQTNGLLITEENGHDAVKVAVSVNKDGKLYYLPFIFRANILTTNTVFSIAVDWHSLS